MWTQDDPKEARVRNLGSFSRFLEAATFSQAQVLNMQKVAADSRRENHFELLEDLLLVVRLPVFKR